MIGRGGDGWPAHESYPADGAAGARPAAARLPGNRPRVLIVDDEPAICKALFVTFEQTGFEPVVALSSDAAMSIVQTQHIDLLLIDLHLRGDLRGDTIFELIAAHQPHVRQHTLFMTGDISEFAHKIIAACQCELLRKPFDLQDVIDAMHAMMPQAHDAAG
ncbi:MAG TPA: response regulator [Gemmatimonadaceae bacterium]|nr:response regulator [Gemmatimonadaceae bacterium]